MTGRKSTIGILIAVSLGMPGFFLADAMTGASPQPQATLWQWSGSHIGLPEQILIPAIGVNAPIVSLAILDDGTMETPSEWMDVGWYRATPRPGEPGSAVLAGHLDSQTGPAVFWSLPNLKLAQDIIVISSSGQRHRFVVTDIQTVDADDPPMEKIFEESDRSMLRLITCSGYWGAGGYSERLVVFAEAVP